MADAKVIIFPVTSEAIKRLKQQVKILAHTESVLAEYLRWVTGQIRSADDVGH